MSKKYKSFQKGIYKPVNPTKYVGVSQPTYRSSYELKFFRWCDNNTNVVKWGSESISIPYVSPVDNRVHHYFPDNLVQIKEGESVKNYIIEIKPSKQVAPPDVNNRKSQKRVLFEQVQWAVNTAKWNAATQWCKKAGFTFLIITEEELKI